MNGEQKAMLEEEKYMRKIFDAQDQIIAIKDEDEENYGVNDDD